MEGPTPGLGVIHAATMVTAGVFMVARLSPLFELAPVALQVVTLVGAGHGASSPHRGARAERHQARGRLFDLLAARLHVCRLRRSGAYALASSTSSRTPSSGTAVSGLGLVIHAMHHEQDMRKMGGLRAKILSPMHDAGSARCR
jgi:NADH-quinone oxidoreductase subunit L